MKRVYWIEDELHLFRTLKEDLEVRRFAVVEIKTASEAEEELRRKSFLQHSGVIVLDLWLPPGRSSKIPKNVQGPELGLWLLRKIRDVCGTTQPIIVLSGNLTVDVLGQLRNEGVKNDLVFSKPITDPDRFSDTVANLAGDKNKEL
jgi:CheY-like chemotaxis protein